MECGNCRHWVRDEKMGYYGDCKNEIVKALIMGDNFKVSHHFGCKHHSGGKDDCNKRP
jgi:hypothetical protein